MWAAFRTFLTGTRLVRALAPWVLAALGVLAAVARQRKDAANDLRGRQARDALDRTEAGRQAVQSGRDSGLSPDDRLRRNDGQWN
jgi:hypothetical protein